MKALARFVREGPSRPSAVEGTAHEQGFDAYVDANATIVEAEIDASVTVSFLNEIDLTALEARRKAEPKESRTPYTAFLAKAVGLALREFPFANRRVLKRPWRLGWGTRLVAFDRADVTIAVERNLPGDPPIAFADILRDADQASLQDIRGFLVGLRDSDASTNAQWRRFSEAITRWPRWIIRLALWLTAHRPSLWVRDRGAAAFISSPSKYGVDAVVGTWSWPLGFSYGLVRERAVVRDGQVCAAPTFMLTMNFDRRVMSGGQAARVFACVSEHLRDPRAL